MGVATYREHLAATRREIREVTAAEAEQLLGAETRPVLVDVRERDEYEQGYISGAVHIPRGNLESRIENTVSDRNAPVILYCAAGNRSAFAAKTLHELGYTDVVDRSNLQRQILHTEDRIGMAKVDSAEIAMSALNPDIAIVKYTERLTSENVLDVITGYDVIIDGTDNFPTRYLLNDASLVANIPVVHGSIYQFEGSVTVYAPRVGPCYRCQYPEPPPPELAPSCAEGGVLGVLPGVVGMLQATEAVKLLLGVGDPLIGRQLRYDALAMEFVELKMHRDPNCPVCSKDPEQIEFIDYEQFCAAPVRAVAPVIQKAVA